jgi:hypothetical protein
LRLEPLGGGKTGSGRRVQKKRTNHHYGGTLMRRFIVKSLLALALAAVAPSAAIGAIHGHEAQDAALTGHVEVTFKSDYFPLD